MIYENIKQLQHWIYFFMNGRELDTITQTSTAVVNKVMKHTGSGTF